MNDDDLQRHGTDRLLRTLCDVQPPAGIEERVLRRLQAAQAGSRPQRKEFRKLRKGGLVAALATCAVMVLCVSALLHQSGQIPTAVRREGVLAARSIPPLPQRQVGVSPSHLGASLRTNEGTRRVAAKAPKRSRGATEITAWVSIPAPPAPPTEQEKVLLRLMQQQRFALSQAKAPVAHTDRPALPEEPLPAFSNGITPGSRLPPFDVAAAPGHPLPPFPQTNLTGDPR